MELTKKLTILADAAKYDASCASSGSSRKSRAGMIGNNSACGVCHSFTPDGRCISLLKILLTNFCIYDCKYCVNRVSSDVPRARFTPEEIAELTISFYRRNYVEGLFLSSGVIRSPDHTMEQLAHAARLLRETYRFNGYIHLKAVPGVSPGLLALAGRYADRLSANIELPTQPDLEKLAPQKHLNVITGTMTDIRSHLHENRLNHPKHLPQSARPVFAPAGQSTQMIVGATPTPDATILKTASDLYHRFELKRVY
jgi:putative DNA modification/repair radical SAM protein